MKNVFKPAVALMLAGLSLSVFAQNAQASQPVAPTAAAVPAIPKALQMAVRGGVKVVKSFPAEGGLTGWVLTQPDGQSTIVYSLAEGKLLMAGALVDETGKNLTAAYMESQVPRPDFSLIEKSSYIIEGTTKNPKAIIYAFLDPNCTFCHLAWKAFQPYEKAGLQVRWMPVAFLKADSMGKAAALMEAKNAQTAMQQHETKFDPQTETGGIEPQTKIAPATQAKIKANGDLMRAFGFNGTPAIVYRDASGKVVTHPGMVRLSELPGMFNMPAQPNDDPALARFK